MKEISSRTNPIVKKVVDLHQAKYRAQYRQFIGQGTRVIATLLASPIALEQLFVTEELLHAAQQLVAHHLITLVSQEVMNKMSTLTEAPGILGIFNIPDAPKKPTLTKGIILYEISDPGNMGTLLRSAAAMNVTTVIACGGVDPWNPKVVQASAGTIGLVNLFEWSWRELLQQKGETPIAALTVQGTKQPEALKHHTILLMVGSEAHGIPKNVLDLCDEKITIPMPGNIESLNAAVAGSIALYLVFMP